MPHSRVIEGLNQLFLLQMANAHIEDVCLILESPAGRPVKVPVSVCEFVETNIEAIMGLLFRVHTTRRTVSETDFLHEVAHIIMQMATSEYGNIHADVEATAITLRLIPSLTTEESVSPAKNKKMFPLYLALAIYAKIVAANRHSPPLIAREEIGRVVHFRYLH